MHKRSFIQYSSFLLTVFLLAGCPSKPQYPKCEQDDQCKNGEFCVNGTCQDCKSDSDCPNNGVCKAGRCELECKQNSDCTNGKACIDNRCVACSSNDQCEDGHCQDGKCVQCVKDEDCPENNECQAGLCVAPPQQSATSRCEIEAIYFNFDDYVLSAEATAKLQEAKTCIDSVSDAKLRIEGHCDARGTEEYNLALGDRRARAIFRYLKRLGVSSSKLHPVSKGKLDATGTSEEGWRLDRKVLFIWE